MRRPYLLGFVLLAFPLSAFAFDTIDTLPWPSLGGFPAYPPEETRPYEVFVEGGLMHDTNIVRRNSNTEYENVMRFGGGGRLEQRVFGRQSVRLEARGDEYLFDRFGDLDHFAYNGAATWLWELGNSLAGTFGYARVHRLASLAEIQRPVRRMVTTDDLFGSAVWRVGPHFRLRGLGAHARSKREEPGVDTVRFGSNSVTAGADLVSDLDNALGVEYRWAHGDAPVSPTVDPNGQFVGNQYQEREAAVVATYVSGPSLRFTGRLGKTKRTYNDLPNNFEGTTWRAGAEWFPGTKTSLVLETYHEPRAIIDVVASHVDVKGTAFGPSWAATAKLVFSVRLVNEHRVFIAADPNVAPPGTLLDETLRVFRFGVGWEPERLMQVGFSVDRGMRESNTLDRNYNYTAVTGNIRVTW
jgi:hypothetical protein